MTDRAERLTQSRESRPTPPTSVIFLLFRQPTSLQNSVSINFFSDWSTGNNRQYRPTFDQTEAWLQAAKIQLLTIDRGNAEGRPRNYV